MDKKINCPRCSTFIKKRVMRKIKHSSKAVLDVCDSCGGMWLDRDEVKLLYQFSNRQNPKSNNEKPLRTNNKNSNS